MYGLSKDIDLDFMINAELDQVCIGLYHILLHFEKSLQISIQSTCYLIDDQGQSLTIPYDDPRRSGQLTALLGSSITSVMNKGDGDVTLSFSND
jgi:hypothetical protein